MKLLVIEDYEPIRTSLVQGLTEAGFAVDATGDGEEGLWFARDGSYDVIVLDLMLPKIDGLSILKHIRHEGSRCPVLILTARDKVDDRVRGLDHGADDYLVKPFAFDEFLARVRALVRRKYDRPDGRIRVGALAVDVNARAVTIDGRPVELTAREYAILEVLALRAGEVLTRTDICQHLYGFDGEPDSNVVDVHIGQIRRKLRQLGHRDLILTRRGLGYVLANGRS